MTSVRPPRSVVTSAKYEGDMAKIERFPKYEFHHDGFVISTVKAKPRIMKPIKMGKYLGLQLKRLDGHIEKAYLHRLICEAHHGPCPAGMECRHIDGDKNNNAAANLAWGTKAENETDKQRHETSPVGERNGMAKLTEAAVKKMRLHRKSTGESYAQIAKVFGISTMTAYRAITGKQWRNVR